MTYIQDQYWSTFVLFILATVTFLAFWVIKQFISPASKVKRNKGNSLKDLSAFVAYECGEVPIGEAQTRFNFQYYVFALVFVIFDVITAFLFPWAIVIKTDLLAEGMISALVFISIFLIGLGYWWKRDALRWM